MRHERARAAPRIATGGKYRNTEARKVVIMLDSETFDEVRERAVAKQVSWASIARMLIEVGLETLKQDGQ